MKRPNWENKLNWDFYENFNEDLYKKWLNLKGLETNIDLKTLNQYILQYSPDLKISEEIKILEVGGGRGRVINWLINEFPKTKIDSLEVTEHFCQYLNKKFSSEKKVSIIKSPIQKFIKAEYYNLILWMWGGILEMTPQEKKDCINILKNNCQKNGIIVIDLPQKIVSASNNPSIDNNFGMVSEKCGDLYFHFISAIDLCEIAKTFGLDSKIISYTTISNAKRDLVILKKV